MASNLLSGQKTVASNATAEQLVVTDFRAYVVVITALKSNTGVINVSERSTVHTTNDKGYELQPEQEVAIFVNNVDTDVYIACSVNGEGVSFIGWIDRGILYKDE
jgi:hypothetical protein